MKLEDFLQLKTEGSDRVAELSCEDLYSRYADAQDDASAQRSSHLNDFFRYLERQLDSTDVLRMQNPDLLEDQCFKARVYELLTEFKARGGRVMLTPNPEA